MNTIYYVLSVAWKELQLIGKDRGMLALLFLLPLLLGSLTAGINIMVEGDGDSPAILLDVFLVNEDTGAFGQEVTKAIEGIDELNIKTLDTFTEAEQRVAKGGAIAAILIPADFSQKIDAHTPTSIDVVVDPIAPQAASIVTGIMNQVVAEVTIWGEVQYGIRTILDESGLLAGASPEEQRAVQAQSLGVIMTRLNEVRRIPAIAVVSEGLEGSQPQGGQSGVEGFLAYAFPGFSVMFIFFIVPLCASTLLKERESGTLRRLIAAPIPRMAIILGKMLAYLVMSCLQVVLLFSVANIAFNMPLGQSPMALAVLTIVVGLNATALGMMIAALAKTAKQAEDVGTVLGIVLTILGGAIPLAGAPLARSEGFIGVVSKIVPHSYAVEGYYSLMAENATFAQILPQIAVLLAMAVVFFLIAVWRFKFE